MIAGLLSLLGSSAVGSLLGGIFAFLNHRTDLETKKIELAHETDKWAHDLKLRSADLEMAKEEAKARLDVAVVETDGAIETARMAAIAASQVADRVTADDIKAAGKLGWMLVIAAVVNKLIRPIATIALAGTAIYLNLVLVSKMTDNWGALTVAQQYDAVMQATAWITGQAGAVLGYWFVSRGTSK